MLDWYKKYSDYIYLFGLILLVVSLPLSRYFTSVAQFVLLGNWVFGGAYKEKWCRLKSNTNLHIFLILFFIHVFGLIYSSDIKYGIHDLIIKLPLFVLPIIIASEKSINKNSLKYILWFFVAAVFASSLLSMLAYLGFLGVKINDVRDISLFISHIRFALVVDFIIFVVLFLLYKSLQDNDKYKSIIFGFLFIWFVGFLFVLQSITGIVLFFITFFVLVMYYSILNKKIKMLLFTILVLIGAFAISLPIVLNEYHMSNMSDVKLEKADWRTKEGNFYYHNKKSFHVENATVTWAFICEKELKEEWTNRSSVDIESKHKNGYKYKHILIRYLTSKGLRKDREGIKLLTNQDVNNIENGETNYRFVNNKGLRYRIYKILWQINIYKNGGNPSGHSVTQRFEYLKTGLAIFVDNPILGVGTGDVKSAFNKKYEENNSMLVKRWRLRTHNQYVTFLITFGVLGFVIIVLSVVLPIIRTKAYKEPLFMIFIFLYALSMITEDSMETQAGITFFAFLYSLYLFGIEKETIYGSEK